MISILVSIFTIRNSLGWCFLLWIVAAPAMGTRLISTSPELTELLFQLGVGNDVVATPQFSEHPPAAKQIAELGPLFSPSIDRTLRVAPDWVLIDQANRNPSYEKALRALHQRYLTLDLSRVDRLLSEADRLLRTIYGKAKGPLAAYRACWSSLQTRGAQRRFLAFAWLSPAILIGQGTFLSDLLSHVGGENALPCSFTPPYPAVAEDWLTLQKVDTVYFLASGAADRELARTRFGNWWPGGGYQIVALPADFFARASLTPLQHLGELLGTSSIHLTKECRAIEVSR